MVEIEVHKSEADQTEKTNLDVNEIISKVRGFVDSVRQMPPNGEPMSISVDKFNFSVGKVDDTYDLTVKLNLTFKPKAAST